MSYSKWLQDKDIDRETPMEDIVFMGSEIKGEYTFYLPEALVGASVDATLVGLWAFKFTQGQEQRTVTVDPLAVVGVRDSATGDASMCVVLMGSGMAFDVPLPQKKVAAQWAAKRKEALDLARKG